jgi:hypothetical protein
MPHGEQYKCTLSVGGRKSATEYVGAPKHLMYDLDSPAAYDEAAHAALSFAIDERKIDASDCDFSDSQLGFRISRSGKSKSYKKRSHMYQRP